MSTIDKLYEDYFKIDNILNLINKKMEISPSDLIRRIRHEKYLIAELICEVMGNINNVVEFSNAYYIDDKNIVPTISDSLNMLGKRTTLVSPFLENRDIDHSFKTINTSVEYPFGIYETNSASNIQRIKNTDLFITEQSVEKYIDHFKVYAGFNTPCIYASSGNLIETASKAEEIRKVFKDATISNELETELNIKIKDDIAAAIYIIKRKK